MVPSAFSCHENIMDGTLTHSGSRQLLLTEYLLRVLSVSGSKSWSSNCNQEPDTNTSNVSRSTTYQMIYIYRYILNCMLPYPPQLLSPYSHSHVLRTVCWRGAQFLTYCTTLCTLCGKSSQPFSTWPSIYHMRWLKTSYSKQFTASICIQAIQAESKNTIGEGGCGLCLLNTLLSYLLIVLGRIHRFLCRLGQQLG